MKTALSSIQLLSTCELAIPEGGDETVDLGTGLLIQRNLRPPLIAVSLNDHLMPYDFEITIDETNDYWDHVPELSTLVEVSPNLWIQELNTVKSLTAYPDSLSIDELGYSSVWRGLECDLEFSDHVRDLIVFAELRLISFRIEADGEVRYERLNHWLGDFT